MKHTFYLGVATIVCLALSFSACDDFFTDGKGSFRDYQVEHINVTVNNLDRWFDRSVGNPSLAARVGEAILLKLDDPSLSPEDRAVFLRAAIRITVASSNMGVIILSNALGALADLADIENLTDEEMADILKNIVANIQGDFKNAGGSAAAANIVSIINRDGGIDEANGVPTFPANSFIRDANPSDVAQTILVLTLAEMEHNNLNDDNWENFDLEVLGLELNESNEVVVKNNAASDTVRVLAAYLNMIADDTSGAFGNNFLTGAISNAFFGR
jgi:hypothetical protein